MLLSVVKEEGLTIINNLDICDGVVTRVDPRNGTETTLDLAICNTFMVEMLEKMYIDEDEQWKLKNYAKKVTKSDHHTIVVKLKVKCNTSVTDQESVTRYNLKNEEARQQMHEAIAGDDL